MEKRVVEYPPIELCGKCVRGEFLKVFLSVTNVTTRHVLDHYTCFWEQPKITPKIGTEKVVAVIKPFQENRIGKHVLMFTKFVVFVGCG